MPDFKRKILIVDDEEAARSALSGTLRSKGYKVIEASTGKDVLAQAKSEWPSLIILDIVLPDMSGTEVFEQLRADPITKAIPVLLLTAKPDIVKHLSSYHEKSDRYLTKPDKFEDLLCTIQEMLTGK